MSILCAQKGRGLLCWLTGQAWHVAELPYGGIGIQERCSWRMRFSEELCWCNNMAAGEKSSRS